MNVALNLLTRLRRYRQSRLLRQGCGHDLPGWALAEVGFTPPQADWLVRTLCAWHALPARGRAHVSAGAVSLVSVRAALADEGIGLRACRLADARALTAGDVVVLTDAAARRLFGDAALGGAGLVLVVAAGSQTLRLSPAMSADPLSCPCADLDGALVGWVLRSRLSPAPATGRASWAGALVAAG